MEKNDFTGYILAGGGSSRMGRDKYALELGGQTFLERAAGVLRGACGDVKVVLNQTQMIETDFPVVRDIFAGRGAPGAIHAALQDCATKYALVLAVDLPLVTAEAVARLAETALEANKFPACVVRQTDGRPQPLFAVYRVRYCLPALENLLNENPTASVRDFFDLAYPKFVEQRLLSDDEDLLLNVNTPEDLARATRK
ncbi:MAG: molybdenum cofactor guanylyltransferase [Acidobacteria bacterium]|nr:molybdenum cofactor guanylyltransferase [Acidobacteriota bacterium]